VLKHLPLSVCTQPLSSNSQVAQQQVNLAQSISQMAAWMANQPSNEEGPKAAVAAGIKMK